MGIEFASSRSDFYVVLGSVGWVEVDKQGPVYVVDKQGPVRARSSSRRWLESGGCQSHDSHHRRLENPSRYVWLLCRLSLLQCLSSRYAVYPDVEARTQENFQEPLPRFSWRFSRERSQGFSIACAVFIWVVSKWNDGQASKAQPSRPWPYNFNFLSIPTM